MRTAILLLVLLVSAAMLHADQAINDAQQVLKDQGFYYGQISGQKNADTTAAIRRFQIRNGLQVTGELDTETLHALGIQGSSRAVAKETPSEPSEPSATPTPAEARNETREEPQSANPKSVEGSPSEQPHREPVYQGGAAESEGPADDLFARTPYEAAPPEVQQRLVVSAQRILTQRGLYDGAIDGIYGPQTEFSLRAYQASVRIPVTGRLDLGTLAALRLLPGANAPVYIPHRRPRWQQPVRGEWIRQ